MSSKRFRNLAQAVGVGTSALLGFIIESPIVARYARGVYGIVGTNISAAEIEAMISPRDSKRRVSQGFGRIGHDRIWVAYLISSRILAVGEVTVPAVIRERVQGEYKLHDRSGAKVGRLVIKGAFARGLVGYLRDCGAKLGDTVLITLHPQAHRAEIAVGDDGLIDGVGGAPP